MCLSMQDGKREGQPAHDDWTQREQDGASDACTKGLEAKDCRLLRRSHRSHKEFANPAEGIKQVGKDCVKENPKYSQQGAIRQSDGLADDRFGHKSANDQQNAGEDARASHGKVEEKTTAFPPSDNIATFVDGRFSLEYRSVVKAM